jgi:hypothetical protein
MDACRKYFYFPQLEKVDESSRKKNMKMMMREEEVRLDKKIQKFSER